MSAENGSEAGRARTREAEALLRSLHGVLLARIDADASGRVHEVRILAEDDATPELVARDVQSALLARYGVFVDLSHIHVAPLPGGTRNDAAHDTPPQPSPNGAGTREASPDTWTVETARTVGVAGTAGSENARSQEAARFDGRAGALPELASLEVERGLDQRVRCTLTLRWNGRRIDGEATTLDDGMSARLNVAARAAVAALNAAGAAPALELDGIRVGEIAGRRYATAAVRAHLGRTVRYSAGAALIEHSAEDAAACAALQAAAPWLAPAQDSTRRPAAAVQVPRTNDR